MTSAARLSERSGFPDRSGGCRFMHCRERHVTYAMPPGNCRKRVELPSQTSRPMTYVVVAYWRPREGQREKVEAILRDLAHAARQEPGNLEFVVNRSLDDPNEFLLYEQYNDEQAFIDHQQTP